MIKEGNKAPAFTLRNDRDEKVTLRDFAGRNVILYFYPKDNTPGCTKEACAFRDAWADVRKRGIEIVGISPDGASSHGRFRQQHRLPFTLLSDPERKMMEKYGAFGEKMMYGKKVKGVVRSTVWIGPDGRVRKHWKKVSKAADHPMQVLDHLREEGV